MEAAEPVEPIRPITVRRGGLQQRQPSSTWASFAPSWIQSGIQTLKQSVFRPSDPSSQQDPLDSLLGKRSEPVDDRDPGPMPKRPRRESPPVNARTGSLEPRSSSIQRSVSPFLIIFSFARSRRVTIPCLLLACTAYASIALLRLLRLLRLSLRPLASHFYPLFHVPLHILTGFQVPLEATGPLPHARTPTLHYTQAAYSQATPQSVRRPSPITGCIPR